MSAVWPSTENSRSSSEQRAATGSGQCGTTLVSSRRASTWVGRPHSSPASGLSSTTEKRSWSQAGLHMAAQNLGCSEAALMKPSVAQPRYWSLASSRCSGAVMLELWHPSCTTCRRMEVTLATADTCMVSACTATPSVRPRIS